MFKSIEFFFIFFLKKSLKLSNLTVRGTRSDDVMHRWGRGSCAISSSWFDPSLLVV